MFVSCVVPSAGRGLRLKSRVSKPLVKIGGIPLLIRTLKTLSEDRLIKEIILVVNKKDLAKIKNNIARYQIKKIKNIIFGGKRRQDSVKKGLKYLDKNCDLVLIHDGARPFIQRQVISKVIKEARKIGAAVAGVPLKPTVKQVSKTNYIHQTLARDGLFEIQTPQVFRKDLILRAYKKFGDTDATDDATLVEKLGVKVKLVRGSYSNIKITTPEDLVFAERIAKRVSNL
ncbi:MAG: 2-C-methyl-D-erythritol 4-phosphate cytidylyltransferase [Candidatus Omnitrophica bacterium]|nr:2-C-methyl-D-erythritol 4-phosphate cytidylyltransferase [Candidatus Omnitrophota bacterium]